MIRTFAKQLVSTVLYFLLVIATTPLETRAQQPAPAGSPAGQEPPLTARKSCRKLPSPSRSTRTPWSPRFWGLQPFQTRLRSPLTGFTRTAL